MTPTEIREAVARLVEEIDGYAESRDSSAQTCIGFAAEDCRPALSALAGMCVLDVETVRLLVYVGNRDWHMPDCSLIRGVPCDCNERLRAALAAAEAEVRRVEVERG